MESKSFLKHFAVIGTGTIINLLLGVLTTPLITRIVDPAEYGQLSIFTMYSGIALMVLCIGLDQALVRYYYESDNIEYKRALLFKCVVLPVVLSLVISAVFIFFTASSVIIFELGTYIAILLCLYTIIQMVYRFSLLLVRLSYQSKLYSMLNVMHKVSYVVITLGLLLLWEGNDLHSLVYGTIGASFICMIASICAQPKMWNVKQNKTKACHIQMSELLRYGYPYIFTMGITTIFQAADKMALNAYCSYTEVGIYSSTMTLIHVFGVIQTTFNSLWAPMAVEHYTKAGNDKTFYQQGNRIITVVMFLMGIMLILFKDIFAVLLGEKYREAAYILPFLVFNPIMYTISETTVTGLVFMKKSKMQVVAAFGACVANIAGNYFLVPIYGCQGAAISTGLSYILFFMLRTVLANWYYYVDFGLKKFYILTSAVVIYACYNTFIKFNVSSIFGAIICIALLYFLYQPTVKWGLNYLKGLLKEFARHILQ